MRLKEAPGYAFRDFWAYKPKRYRWFYKLLSFCIAPALVYLCKSAEAIPVYTDRRYLLTVRATLEKLENGKSIIIFPECHTRYNAIVNEFKEGFAELAAYYYKRYGKEISFVPVYIAPKIKKVVFGSPVKYDPSVPIEEQRLAICNHLKSEITAAANSLPVHTVIPYANIPKKEYPVSQISGKNSVRNIDFDIER